MNISFLFPANVGKARQFLVSEVLSAAAKQQGHNVVSAEQADFVVLFDNQIPSQAAGKKGAVLNLDNAFANPENALQQAVNSAQTFANATTSAISTSGVKNIVAVTACPTGVAHTFMSAEAIENYAKAQGWNVKVETRGQVGAGNPISAEEVAAADLVFVAADIDVDLSKFEGKPAFVLGLCFISEGALPFVAADPVRVIGTSILGGSIAGAISMGLSIELQAPHGGLFVIPFVSQPVMYLAAIAIGAAVTGVTYAIIKPKAE